MTIHGICDYCGVRRSYNPIDDSEIPMCDRCLAGLMRPESTSNLPLHRADVRSAIKRLKENKFESFVEGEIRTIWNVSTVVPSQQTLDIIGKKHGCKISIKATPFGTEVTVVRGLGNLKFTDTLTISEKAPELPIIDESLKILVRNIDHKQAEWLADRIKRYSDEGLIEYHSPSKVRQIICERVIRDLYEG